VPEREHPPKLQVKRDEKGRLVVDVPTRDITPTTEVAERAPMPNAGALYFTRHGGDQAG
jgi:hypothetical protein